MLQSMDVTALMQWVGRPEGVAILVAAGALLLFAVWLFSHRKKMADARLIKKIFARHCEAIERDVVLPDGLDGFMFVDYLLLLPGRIIAFRQLSKKGVVLCLAEGDEWTCINNNRSEKFRNPLIGLQQSVRQMQHDLNFRAIEACVLFGSDSEFPKGAVAGVVRLAELDEALASRQGSEKEHEPARACWERLVEMNRQARRELEQQLSS